jgi:hypothetical protein
MLVAVHRIETLEKVRGKGRIGDLWVLVFIERVLTDAGIARGQQRRGNTRGKEAN